MLIPVVLALTLAQSQDITLSLGALNGPNTKAGLYLGANYAHRIVHRPGIALSGQLDFAASPNRKSSVLDPLGSRDVASLYVIPGLRLSFMPNKRFSPFIAGGVGLASYEQSALLQNGKPYPGSRAQNDFAVSGAVGMDVHILRFAGLRFEIKNYQKDVAAGVGLHFRWGAK